MYIPLPLNAQYQHQMSQKIRENVNELDKKARTMAGILNRVHSTPPDARQFSFLSKARGTVASDSIFTQSLLCWIPFGPCFKLVERQYLSWPLLYRKISSGAGKTCGQILCERRSLL